MNFRNDKPMFASDRGPKGVRADLEELLQLRFAARKLAFKWPKKALAARMGEYGSAFRGRGMEFDEIRNYQFGDDIRRMDWRVTARTGQPYTKVFREERERPVILVVDQSSTMHFGTRSAFKAVSAAHAAAMLAWASIHHGDRVGGFVFSQDIFREIRPCKGVKGVVSVINAMMHVNHECLPNTNTGATENGFLTSVMRKLNHAVRPGSLIFFFSDFFNYTPEHEIFLRKLCHHNELVLALVHDSLEENPPPPGRYLFSDGIRFLELNTSSEQLQREYRDHFRRRRELLAETCKKLHLHFFSLATHESVETVLKQALNRGYATQCRQTR